LRDADLQEQFKKQGAAASPIVAGGILRFPAHGIGQMGGLAKAVGAKID